MAAPSRGGSGAAVPAGTGAELFAHFFEQAPVALVVYDLNLHLVQVNATFERVSGLVAEEVVGRHVREVYSGADGDVVEARLRSVLETGVPVRTTEHRGGPRSGGRDRVWAMSSFRLTRDSGEVVGVATVIIDMTERSHAQARLSLMKEAGERIGSTLDVTRTAEEFTEVTVPDLADFATVDLLEGVARGEEPAPGPAEGAAVLRRAALRSVTEHAPEALYQVGATLTFHPSTLLADCLASGQSALVTDLMATAGWQAHDPARAARMIELGIHSAMIVPLKARDITLGLAHFYRWRASNPFEEDDLNVAQELVARAAVCVDNARRFTGERRAARALQDSLLREPEPARGSLAVTHRYLPARSGVGGDWFDVIELSGARTALVVGDVPGRGIEAVARAGRLRTAVRTLAGMGLPPDEVLAHLDHAVSGTADHESDAAAPLAGIGATCLFLIHDAVTGHCQAASAGHLPPAVARDGKPATLLELPVGPPLGLGGLPFETVDLGLEEGSLLALFTNGLVQQRGSDLDGGLDRLCRSLTRPLDHLDELAQLAVDSALGAAAPDDDAVLLLARTRILAPDQVATWDLPANPSVVSHARAMAGRQLDAWGLSEMSLTTELVVSELVTNAIRYGRSPIQLRLIHDRTLTCEVSDASHTSPHLRLAGDTDEGGRGLFMIAQLAEDWGTRYTPTGKTIWAEQAIRPGELPFPAAPTALPSVSV